MKVQIQQPKATETIKPKAGNQAPVSAILAGYGNQSFQNQYESTNSNHVLQAKYYNADENKVLQRPPETEDIKLAKDKAKADSKRLGHPIEEFTAHHKYPWNKIKDDTENAFSAPKSAGSLKALKNLELFAKEDIPTSYDKFLNSVDHRSKTYSKNEAKFDSWIQNVCWVPGNIFLGPLSDKRIDDPSKRTGNDDFDGHYPVEGQAPKLSRRMSMRSEQLRNVYKSGGLANTKAELDDNTVAFYNPEEWRSHKLGEGKEFDHDMYAQKSDPYFEENIFSYRILSNNLKDLDYKKDIYNLFILTADEVSISQASCDKKILGDRSEAVQVDGNVEEVSQNAKGKRWKVSFLVDDRNSLSNFKLFLEKERGKQKVTTLNEIKIIKK